MQYGNRYTPRYYRITTSMIKCTTLLGNLENKKIAEVGSQLVK